MKIAIYSENLLANSGGAEVYALKLAEVLNRNHTVELFTVLEKKIEIESIFKKYHTPFFTTKLLPKKKSKCKFKEIINRIFFWFILKKQIDGNFDYYINTSCNRMFGFRKIKSIHLIHFPVQPYSKVFKGILGEILDKSYCNSYSQFWSNSEFTKKYVKEYWNIDSNVVNPPIAMDIITQEDFQKKENIIIAVGRLVPDKKIRELIEAFLIIKEELENYKFIIIGNRDSNYYEYYRELIKYAQNDKSIQILTDVSYNDLVANYKKARIFWHAKGFDVEDENPILMEHFGMTTVEAMANGCIPIVINKAGQTEIVEDNYSGFLWNSILELQEKTKTLVRNKKIMDRVAKCSMERSKKFLMDDFSKKIDGLMK